MTVNELSQQEYKRLISNLAYVLRTKPRFITILSCRTLENGNTVYKVKNRMIVNDITMQGEKVVQVAWDSKYYAVT